MTRFIAALGLICLALCIGLGSSTPARAQTSGPPPARTVILVHGAWADGSSWEKVIPYLQAQGVNVVAVQNPLSSLPEDVASVRRVIADQPGDVILVGHSYGGVVITEAGVDPKVKALVYVAAFAPGPGESVQSILAGFAPPPWFAGLHADAAGWITWPTPAMAQYFSAGLTPADQGVLAAAQHPTHASVNAGAVGSTAAWSGRPVWSVIAEQDQIIPAPLQDAFAARMNAQVTRVAAGHLVMLAQPRQVADVILTAARAPAA